MGSRVWIMRRNLPLSHLKKNDTYLRRDPNPSKTKGRKYNRINLLLRPLRIYANREMKERLISLIILPPRLLIDRPDLLSMNRPNLPLINRPNLPLINRPNLHRINHHQIEAIPPKNLYILNHLTRLVQPKNPPRHRPNPRYKDHRLPHPTQAPSPPHQASTS